MQQITFRVPPQGNLRAILSLLKSMKDVTDIHVSNLSDSSDNQIVGASRNADSIEEMLADWTDMDEPVNAFRKRIWKKESF